MGVIGLAVIFDGHFSLGSVGLRVGRGVGWRVWLLANRIRMIVYDDIQISMSTVRV